METLLAAGKLYPVYVDPSRRDIAIPVILALMIPGVALMADFDRCARVSPRRDHNDRRLAVGRGHRVR